MSLLQKTGENQVWDFTTLLYDDSFSTVGLSSTSTNISGSPAGDDPHFSQATHVTRTEFGFSGTDEEGGDFEIDIFFYTYQILNDDSFTFLGSVSFDSDNPEIIDTYSYSRPGEVIFKFPVSFGSSWDYEYESEEIIENLVESKDDVSVSVEVDGWGEIITPNGTFKVLRKTEINNTTFLGFFPVTEIEVSFVTENGIPIAFITGELDPTTDEIEEETLEAQLTFYNEQMTTSNELLSEVPQKMKLDQNYPNPFNPTTQITYELSEQANVTLEVYSITGKRVATLISNRSQPAGSYSIPFDASQFASGIYVYRLSANNQTFTRKMTLIK
ncbi:MAG: T9SS type A sorting domain-containing protein [Balneolaceae bacterium]